MSSPASAFSIDLAPPRSLAALRVFLLAAGVAALAGSGLWWPLRLALGVALGAGLSVSRQADQAALPRRLVLADDGAVTLARIDGSVFVGRLAGHASVGTLALLLWLAPASGGRARRVFLARDAMAPDDYRRLRTALRLRLVVISRASRSAA